MFVCIGRRLSSVPAALRGTPRDSPAPRRWVCFEPPSQRWKTSQGTGVLRGAELETGNGPGAGVPCRGTFPGCPGPHRGGVLCSQSLPRASLTAPSSSRCCRGAPRVLGAGEGLGAELVARQPWGCPLCATLGCPPCATAAPALAGKSEPWVGSAGLRAGRAQQAPAWRREDVLDQTSQTLFLFPGF